MVGLVKARFGTFRCGSFGMARYDKLRRDKARRGGSVVVRSVVVGLGTAVSVCSRLVGLVGVNKKGGYGRHPRSR